MLTVELLAPFLVYSFSKPRTVLATVSTPVRPSFLLKIMVIDIKEKFVYPCSTLPAVVFPS